MKKFSVTKERKKLQVEFQDFIKYFNYLITQKLLKSDLFKYQI